MNLGNSIRQGTVWLLTGRISRKILEFFIGIALARLLLPEDFGLLVTVQIFTGAAGFIAGGGMGQALIQAKHADKRHFQVVFTLQLLICSIIYAFFYHFSPWFANWFNTPIYTDLLRLSALTFLIRPFANIARAKLSREMRFKAIAIISICAQIIGSSLSIYLAFNGNGVWSLLLGGLASTIFSTVCFIIASKSYPGIHFDKTIARHLGSYGVKFSTNDIICYIKSQTPNFIIGKHLGSATVGLFNKGNSLGTMPVNIISGSTYQTIFRALSKTQDNLDQSKYIYLRTITLVSVYTFPFYMGLFWLSEAFIVTIYGEKWQMAAVPLQILSISGLLRCVSNPSGAVMAAQKRLGTEIKLQFITLILTVLGCLYGVAQSDLTSISLGILPGAFFLTVALSYYALRQLNATFSELFQALRPAIKLNLCLASILALSSTLINTYLPDINTAQYLIALSSIGGFSYGILFLFYPIRALKKESLRWKKLLMFSKA